MADRVRKKINQLFGYVGVRRISSEEVLNAALDIVVDWASPFSRLTGIKSRISEARECFIVLGLPALESNDGIKPRVAVYVYTLCSLCQN